MQLTNSPTMLLLNCAQLFGCEPFSLSGIGKLHGELGPGTHPGKGIGDPQGHKS